MSSREQIRAFDTQTTSPSAARIFRLNKIPAFSNPEVICPVFGRNVILLKPVICSDGDQTEFPLKP